MPAVANQWTHDEWLSNYAVDYSGAFNKSRRIGTFLCPIVPVTITDGKYDYHDPKENMTPADTSRGLGQASTRIHTTVEKRWYSCQSQGLAFEIDDDELARMRGTGEEMAYKQAKVENLINRGLLSYDKRVLDMLEATVTPTTAITNLENGNAIENIGQWSDGSVDPFEQLKALRLWFKARTGLTINKMAFGALAWEKTANNPLMRDHIRYNSIDELTEQLLLTGLRLDRDISPDNVLIVDDGYNAALPGGEMDPRLLAGNDVWLFYSQDTPSLYDPSFAKCFNTGGTSFVSQVQSILIPNLHVEASEVVWMDDPKVTAPLSGMRITVR